MRILPPGKSIEDKYYIGFYQEGKLIAVMDLIDMCMSNNWKGIIWDKLNTKQSGNKDIVNEWRNS